MVFSVMDTASDSQLELLSAREIVTLSDSSYPTSLSRSENISEVSVSVAEELVVGDDSVVCCVVFPIFVLQPDSIKAPIVRNNKIVFLRIGDHLLNSYNSPTIVSCLHIVISRLPFLHRRASISSFSVAGSFNVKL